MTDVLAPGAFTRRPAISARSLSAALGLPPPTDEQVAVIEAPMEPLLVVAGAGAGKTETMAARVVWLVANRMVSPDEVTGLTFTRKAAAELAARIRRRLAMLAASSAMLRWDPDGSTRAVLRAADPEVSTYHAYAGGSSPTTACCCRSNRRRRCCRRPSSGRSHSRVVGGWTDDLETSKTPQGVTESVLSLYSDAAEHLVDLTAIARSGTELHRLIDTLPPGPRQRAEPAQALRAMQEGRRRTPPAGPAGAALGRHHARPERPRLRQSDVARGAPRPRPSRGRRGRARDRPRRSPRRVPGHRPFSTDPVVAIVRWTVGTRPPARRVTAVGDPIQSIYGWRGASAANLPRFATDFPTASGAPAPRRELLTSWRNPRTALRLANRVSEDLRAAGIPVSVLRSRDDAPEGTVDVALHETVEDERVWIADAVVEEYDTAEKGRGLAAHHRDPRAPQRGLGAPGREARGARHPRRGGRDRRAAVRPRDPGHRGHAAPHGRPDGRYRGDATAHRRAVPPGRRRPRRAVASGP